MSGSIRFRAVINLKGKKVHFNYETTHFLPHSSSFLFFNVLVFQRWYFTTSLCYFPSRGLVNETLDHNETAAVMCSEMREAFFTVVLLLSNFKDSLEDL